MTGSLQPSWFLNLAIYILTPALLGFWWVPEKAMAPHSSTLAWKIPWMEELGRLQSMGSLRVGHDWATSLSLFTFMHWRRKWQPLCIWNQHNFINFLRLQKVLCVYFEILKCFSLIWIFLKKFVFSYLSKKKDKTTSCLQHKSKSKILLYLLV